MPDPARILREAYDNVRHEYRTAIGQRRDELITPAVVHEDIVVDIWPIIPRGPGHHGISDLG